MDNILKRLQEGKIPYRYEFDTTSGLYFAVVVAGLIFAFAFAKFIARSIVGV